MLERLAGGPRSAIPNDPSKLNCWRPSTGRQRGSGGRIRTSDTGLMSPLLFMPNLAAAIFGITSELPTNKRICLSLWSFAQHPIVPCSTGGGLGKGPRQEHKCQGPGCQGAVSIVVAEQHRMPTTGRQDDRTEAIATSRYICISLAQNCILASRRAGHDREQFWRDDSEQFQRAGHIGVWSSHPSKAKRYRQEGAIGASPSKG